ncbi:hypothetical protein ACXYMU_18900 [Pontibacter sp. CAU 1760]
MRFLKIDHPLNKSRVFSWVTGFVLWATLGAASPPPDTLPPIALRNERLPFTPREFYVAQVIDEREDRKYIGYLLPPVTQAPAKPSPVDLQGGGLAAIQAFYQSSLSHNKALRPVIVRLQECRVTETPGAKPGRVNGQVAVAMAFEYKRGGQVIPLLEYKGGIRYDRPAGQLEVVEPALRRALADAVQYLNTWMDREAGTNEKLATSLHVTFKDHTQQAPGDTVFYSPNRPLVWADFRGAPSKPTHFAAAVFPSFAYEGQPEVTEGVLHLNLTMKVFVLKGSSWVKDAARNAYSLNHEQRHFEIVKLVAERFKQKLTTEHLTLEDYNSQMQYAYIESFREMNRMQEQYDSETRHGIDQVAQARWDTRIAAELKQLPSGQ